MTERTARGVAFATFLWMWTAPLVWAGPVEIATLGPTTGITAHLDRVRRLFSPKANSSSRALIPVPARADLDTHRFPITTHRMRPGRVISQRSPRRGAFRPLCVVGNDPESFRWARQRAARLKILGAACLMVQARDAREVEAMRQSLSGVPLAAVSGDGLAGALGLTRYPVLLTTEAIEQ